jgi:hypothetical protein
MLDENMNSGSAFESIGLQSIRLLKDVISTVQDL